MPQKPLLKGFVGALAGGVWFVTATAGTSADPVHPPPSPAAVSSPTVENARERIATLRAEIGRHDLLYFQKAAPEISDVAYDALKRELRALELSFPAEAAAVAALPTLVDDHTDGFRKAMHRAPMLSLDKAYTEAELRDFCARISTTLGHPADFVIEPKIDGLAVSAIYEQGHFVRAVTRGNGREGDDITANVLAIRSLPRVLRTTAPDGTRNALPDFIELRGEIYLSWTEFARLNREREAAAEPLLAHPRNVAAGTIKSNDPGETASRRLDIVFYGWGACEPATTPPATQEAFHAQAKAWGLPVLETYQIVHDADGTWAAVQSLGRLRGTLAAPTDGVAIKLDNTADRPALGESEQAPRWAVAYKFPPERAATQLRGITLQVGRTGLLTPVAEFAPITLGGGTITRASLHNRAVIARLDLHTDDFVFVEKAGEIIPEIVGVDRSLRPASSKPCVFPSACPACDAPAITDQDGTIMRCANLTGCPGQLRQRLAHFSGKSGAAIAGLGEATIAELVASGHVRSPADLYKLRADDLTSLPGLGAKSSAQLLAEIERSRRTELWRFINGLSIPRVGPATAKILARHFGSLGKLGAAQPSEFPSRIGNATRQTLATYLSSPENRAALSALDKEVHPLAARPDDGHLDGKIFVLTGLLPTMSREEATRRIEAAGGTVSESVSQSTHYVIAGTDAGEKLKRARNFNLPVLDEAALLRLLANQPDAP